MQAPVTQCRSEQIEGRENEIMPCQDTPYIIPTGQLAVSMG